jgi:Cu/Ag efflux pump CusA
MIARLIAWSARNLLLVFFGTVFAAAAGIYALAHLPLDAIPDLSDTQVIVYTEYPGQAPQVIEDQVTYPLTTAMLTVPDFPSSGFRSSTLSSRTAPTFIGPDRGCWNFSTVRRRGCLPA